jgi:hypothetical protein
MATEPTYDFPLSQNSYAAFDAISLRNLIINRLNEQGKFTDQNYIGSNLASIIDIISYSFNTLIFYLNKTSNESMFTEAQIYENINRIVKILDYKPVGYQTSTLAFSCSAENFTRGVYTIPRYSYAMVAGIPFSFNEDVTFSVTADSSLTSLTDLTNKKLLYQGTFRENPVYTAAGNEDEVVGINVADALIDHHNIHVYVRENKSLNPKWIQYTNVPNLYSENAASRSFEKRLGSNGLYEILFGNNVNGRKLDQGDQVAIYFLQSSGVNGVVGVGALNSAERTSLFGTSLFTNQISPDVNSNSSNYLNASQLRNLIFENVSGSTLPTDVEGAESIRKNAPAAFKSQYRLVTAKDFETFIRINFANIVSDVKVFSNWEYTGQYLKYFYNIGISPEGFNQIVLNQVLFADSCNFNNIYICCIPKISQESTLKYLLPAQKQLISSNLEPLKILTSEITFMDPIYKAITFGTKTNNPLVIDEVETHVLQIVKTKSNQRTARSIQQEAAKLFKEFFSLANTKIGSTLDYASLVSKLLSIDGVHKLVTKNTSTNEVYEGLSFYMWNPMYPDLDKQVVVNNLTLENFELLYFVDLSTVDSKIIVTEV